MRTLKYRYKHNCDLTYMTQNKPFRVYMLKYMAAPIHITTQWMLSKLLKRKAALIVLIWCIPYKKYVHANFKKKKI